MTVAVVLVVLAMVAVAICAIGARSSGSGAAGTQSARFRGHRVESPVHRSLIPATAPKARMRNGRKVSAVRNGRAVTREDAIGLGCLAPISECRLGANCICREQAGAGRRVHL